MTFRTRITLAVGAWFVLVTGVLVAVPVALRDRLPDPIASHWEFSGAPDGSMSLVGLVVLDVVLWLLFAGAGVATVLRGEVRRAQRSSVLAALGFGSVFAPGLLGSTVWANLDVGSWREARPLSWQALLVVVCALLVGALAAHLGRRGPADPPGDSGATPAMTLRSGQRAVWVSSGASRFMTVLGTGLLVVAVVLTGAAAGVSGGAFWGGAGVAAVSGLAVLLFSSVRVQVGAPGVVIAFGPLRWPVRRVLLDRIETARCEVRRPAAVGGWGYRGLPGNATIMIRGGECLVLRYTSGGELGISVDDAERGAALINGLLVDQRA